MTIAEFEERARSIEEIASIHLGPYKEFYNFTFLTCGNIEFEVRKDREDDLLKILPEEMVDFPIYIQFGWYCGEWHRCLMKSIHNVELYKKIRRQNNDRL